MRVRLVNTWLVSGESLGDFSQNNFRDLAGQTI